MAEAGEAVDRLIALMARLPGLGPRSARRAVLAMVRRREVLQSCLPGRLPRHRIEAAAGHQNKTAELSRAGLGHDPATPPLMAPDMRLA
jgi:hypothetical protein